jgi:hypothetical protein
MSAAQWMNVMVEFTNSNSVGSEKLSRGERYRQLKDNAERHREELQAWIANVGLENDVKDVGDALAFDLLFATVTPEAAAALKEAPGVVAVRPAPDSPAPDWQGASGMALPYA